MINQINITIVQKALYVIYDIGEDTKVREIDCLREKALNDEASALKRVREEWAISRDAEIVEHLKVYGMTD